MTRGLVTTCALQAVVKKKLPSASAIKLKARLGILRKALRLCNVGMVVKGNRNQRALESTK